jgi:hypothetical protein
MEILLKFETIQIKIKKFHKKQLLGSTDLKGKYLILSRKISKELKRIVRKR